MRRFKKPKPQRTPKQRAQDARLYACGRKVFYISEEAAQVIAAKMDHRVYKCSYCVGFHTAHLPGSQRIIRQGSVSQ